MMSKLAYARDDAILPGLWLIISKYIDFKRDNVFFITTEACGRQTSDNPVTHRYWNKTDDCLFE